MNSPLPGADPLIQSPKHIEGRLEDGTSRSFASLDEATVLLESLGRKLPRQVNAEAPSETELARIARLKQGRGLAFRFPEDDWPPAVLFAQFIETCKKLGIPQEKYQDLGPPLDRTLQKVFNLEAHFQLPDFEVETDIGAWVQSANKAWSAFRDALIKDLRARAARHGASSMFGTRLTRPQRKRRKRDITLTQKLEWCALSFVEGWGTADIQRDLTHNPNGHSRQAIEAVYFGNSGLIWVSKKGNIRFGTLICTS